LFYVLHILARWIARVPSHNRSSITSVKGSSINSTSYMNSTNSILSSKELVQQARLVAPTPALR